MFNFLSQRVISVAADIVNIDIVIISNKKVLIIIVYKLKNLCSINKVIYITNIMLEFLILW